MNLLRFIPLPASALGLSLLISLPGCDVPQSLDGPSNKEPTPDFTADDPHTPVHQPPPSQRAHDLDVIPQAIVDGTEGIFSPYAAAIKDARGNVSCSGTFISPHVVLTAAHCVPPAASVATGRNVNTRPRNVYTITNRFVHPSYVPDGTPGAPFSVFEHPRIGDVGLLVVAEAFVPFAGAIPGVFQTIDDQPLRYAGLQVALVGYGMTQEPTTTQDRTGAGIQRSTHTNLIAGVFGNNDEIFYYEDATHSTRSLDSGGPTYISRNGQLRIVGVHAGYFERSRIPSKGYDTKVSLPVYADWIYQTAMQVDPLPSVAIEYSWTADDGIDLDTRTTVTAPPRSAPVGWGRAVADGPTDRPYLSWTSRDNTQTGLERTVADAASLATDFPPTTEAHAFRFGLAAFWYNTRKAGDVVLSVTDGQQAQRKAVNVSLQTRSASSNGEPLATVTIDAWSRWVGVE